MNQTPPPVALTIAGSDSSAGAGIQADLKTFAALGVYGLNAVTCVVAEVPGKVSRIQPVVADMVREQVQVLATSFPIGAIKTGLLCSSDIVATVARAIVDLAPNTPLVVDPVILATTGDRLLDADAVATYASELFPRATLITPNLDEATVLLGQQIQDRQAMDQAARALAQKFGTAVLLKGGHLKGKEAVDLLFANNELNEFRAPFVRGVATHGTGCAYSAAIAAGLAARLPLVAAIQQAKDFVTAAIAHRFRWPSASGANIDALNHRP